MRARLSIFLVGIVGSVVSCQQTVDIKTEVYPKISFLGGVETDAHGNIHGHFYYLNPSNASIQSVAIIQDQSGFYCAFPVFEYLENGLWQIIKVCHQGIADPIVIGPSQEFRFKADLDALYRVGQKEAYRIIVDQFPSEPFALKLDDFAIKSFAEESQ